jgi:hypothetical protein
MSKKNDKKPTTSNKQAAKAPAAPKAVLKWAISAKDGKKAVIFDEEKVSLPYVTADEVEQYISNAVKELQRISSSRVREEALSRKEKKNQGSNSNQIPANPVLDGEPGDSQGKPTV